MERLSLRLGVVEKGKEADEDDTAMGELIKNSGFFGAEVIETSGDGIGEVRS